MGNSKKTINVLIGGVNTFLPKELIKGIEAGCKQHDANVLFFLGTQTRDFYEAVLNVKGKQSYDYQFNTIYDYSTLSGADGVILNHGTIGIYLKNSNVIQFAAKYDDRPLVLLTDYAEGSKYTSIIANNYQGIYDLVSHLVEKHHCQKIGHVAGPQCNQDAVERLNGYLDACKAYGLVVTPDMIVEGDYSEFVTAEVEKLLDQAHITANKNTIPGEPLSPFITSGVRLGSPAVTTRGFKEPEMDLIAGWIADIIKDFEGNKERVSREVQELCAKYPIY